MSDDEARRARNAEYARKYRARKAASKTAGAAAASDAADVKPPTTPTTRASLLESAKKSIQAMKWLEDSDQTTVDLVLMNAQLYDELLAADPNAIVKATSLSNLILRGLHELAGTPTVRLQHEVRSRKLQRGEEDGDAEQSKRPAGEDKSIAKDNVTPIRPQKTKRQR